MRQGLITPLHPYEDRPTPTHRLIGLGGLKESGKDAFANALESTSGYTVRGMLDAVNEALQVLNPLIPRGSFRNPEPYTDYLARVGYVAAKRNPEVRRLLQALGTEVGRDMLTEDAWVNVMSRHLYQAKRALEPLVITGIRFPNEVAMIREWGGVLVWVDRPEVTARHEEAVKGANSLAGHASERSVNAPSFDWLVSNSGSLSTLDWIAYEFDRVHMKLEPQV